MRMESINHRQAFYSKEAFNLNFLDDIVKKSKLSNSEWNDGSFSGDSDSTNSENRLTWPISDLPSLQLKLKKIINDVNIKNYQFELGFLENALYIEYNSKNNNKLDWHMDIGPYPYNQRKLSFSIFLNDPSEYEGGQLEIWMDNNQYDIIPKTKGGIVVFPSFLLHRVTPVTKGIRKVIVGFINGNPYR